MSLRQWEVCGDRCPTVTNSPCSTELRNQYLKLWADELKGSFQTCSGKKHKVSRLTRLKTFTCAHLFHLFNGMPRIDAEEIAAREAACNSCDHNIKGACELCTCPIKGILRNKLRMPLEQCPDNPARWNAVTMVGWRKWTFAVSKFLLSWGCFAKKKEEVKVVPIKNPGRAKNTLTNGIEEGIQVSILTR